MPEEDVRVRVLTTGEYGTVAEYSPAESCCLVELDSWQFGRRREDKDRDDEKWYNFAFDQPERRDYPTAQVEKLVEVGPADRRAVLEGFEALALVSTAFFDHPDRPIVVIRRTGDGLDVVVRSHDCKVYGRRTLRGADAKTLVSAVLATHADEWTETFEPECCVLDGYGWDMTVYSGNRYFRCDGSNAAPRELADLLYAVADAGLPLAWDGDEIGFANDEGAGE